MTTLQHVEARLTLVLKGAAGLLPEEQLADMLSLVEAGEPGIALENFCTQLDEYDVAVAPEIARELSELAALMEMEDPQVTTK